jgi:hypothetical protein
MTVLIAGDGDAGWPAGTRATRCTNERTLHPGGGGRPTGARFEWVGVPVGGVRSVAGVSGPVSDGGHTRYRERRGCAV